MVADVTELQVAAARMRMRMRMERQVLEWKNIMVLLLKETERIREYSNVKLVEI
jgi:hypothetical protein